MKLEHNVKTNEIVVRELTDEELAAAAAAVEAAANTPEAIAKREAEAARQALLDKLGITADEAKLLLG